MNCNAQTGFNAKRFIIEQSVYEEFKDRLLQILEYKVKIGDPLDNKITVGPLAVQRNLIELKSQVKNAVERDGGRIIYGDPDWKIDDPLLEDGNFMQPIVTEGINTLSPSYQEEFYGPVFNLYKANTPKEALDMANASDYGLAGTIFTEDLDLAENYAVKMRVGSITINDMMASFSDLPSGGVKMSGFGRECYRDGLMEIAYRKSIIGKNW